MGVLWGLVRAVMLFFAAIIALLVVIDGTLFANLFRKNQ